MKHRRTGRQGEERKEQRTSKGDKGEGGGRLARKRGRKAGQRWERVISEGDTMDKRENKGMESKREGREWERT